MGDFNSVQLLGRLTRDVELKYTKSGTAVGNVGIAVGRRVKRGDSWETETTFVDCVAWGNTAENMSKFLGKGREVFIAGRLKLDQWQDKDGKNRSKLTVVIENCQFVGPKEGGGSRELPNKGNTDIESDDIPF
jgi:single-strand DNA-binding protein